MRFVVFLFLLHAILFAEDFITKMEYAKMLYANPRGIGCNLCHGQKGEGTVIAKYKDKGKQKELRAPDITKTSREKFQQAFASTHTVMPRYFLTNNEIEMLYFYVTSEVNK
ncbi:MAG: cytochrome c [Sulfurospirillum sp.]|nr:cytochrome c [Sulfurospirillum sp.]